MSIGNILTWLFAHDIDGTQPHIVDLEQPIQIIGMTVDTGMKNVYRDVPSLGKQFRKYKQVTEIPNKKQPWAFAAVSKGYDREKGTFSYTMGDVVTSLEEIPAGLMSLEIPAIKYAVFPVRPKNRFGWPIAIGNTKRYAYDIWLPNSGYEPAGVVDDFEYHDERSVRKGNPEIDLYVAIREKH
ncbi:MAG: GyrI-like domain-containing protein [Anaerolineae bacterium]|nr:GyrI-like domain-containing protein [Anaerolineae bacterium]